MKKLNIVRHKYNTNIDGWMSKEELAFLHDVAGNMKDIVELGSYRGKSTVALASNCGGTVTAVDQWKPCYGIKGEDWEEIYKDFQKNIKEYDNIRVIKNDTVKASKRHKKVDMVFIDADHRHEAVVKDINAWLPKTKKLICGHDYDDKWVKKAVDELIKIDGTVCSIWYKYVD